MKVYYLWYGSRLRIREVLRSKEIIMIGANNPVEADETFVGGSITNKHNSVRKYYAANPHLTNKTTVLGMVERGGRLVANVIQSRTSYELATQVATNVENKSTLITDDTNLYQQVASSYNHHSVNHRAKEYSREGGIHTNTIEGAFSLFKRSIFGIYHQITPKHTQRYCDEFTYRYNSRKMNDADRFALSIQSIECRLKYKTLIAAPEPFTISTDVQTPNTGKGIFQIKDGEIVGHYASLAEAKRITKINKSNILSACKGRRKDAGGFNWCFA